MRSRLLAALLALAALAAAACAGGGATPAADGDSFLVGQPQNRAGIGDVDRAFNSYAATRADVIALYQAQPWFGDGLTRDEALFVERGLSFVARYSGPRTAYVSSETIEKKLYRYNHVRVASGEIELLLIFEPGQDADQEMGILTKVIPALESLVGVQFPESVLTVINGSFEINDFNDGQFIRIARCCVQAPFILAHELAHTYWSIGPSWFNEGMADIYATMALAELDEQSTPGWRKTGSDLDAYHRSRRAAIESGRFPELVLPRRFASDGLYESADVFLLDIRKHLGDGAFRAAARAIYLASDFGRYNLREARIEDAFLQRAKAEARDAVTALFNRLIWGDNGERYRQLQELAGS